MQKANPLVKNPNNNQGYFREYGVNVGAGTNMGGAGSTPINSLGFEVVSKREWHRLRWWQRRWLGGAVTTVALLTATADDDEGHRRRRQRPPTMATASTKKGLRGRRCDLTC